MVFCLNSEVSISKNLSAKVSQVTLDNTLEIFNGLAEGEGDLTQHLPASHIRLLDNIAADFNIFISTMSNYIRGLKETSQTLNNIANTSSEHQVQLEALSNQ